MKLVAYLLITLGLIAGALASATAYLVDIEDAGAHQRLADAELVLKSPAGQYDPSPDQDDDEALDFAQRVKTLHEALNEAKQAAQDIPNLVPDLDLQTPVPSEVDTEPPGVAQVRSAEARAPIARPGDPLTLDLLALLRESGVENVRVKSFSLLRWPHNWLFALGVVLLLAGAFIVKAQQRATRKLSPQQEKTERSGAGAAMASIAETLEALKRDLPAMSDEQQQLHAIVERLGQVQKNDVPAFAADRPRLVSDLGLGGFAELMDHFAGLERQINRAWSAAADGVLPESREYIDAASERVPMVTERLPGPTPR